jgi:hypothetical protein
MELEFLKFDKTPQEKHLGVASIRADRRFIFRFKIMSNPKGEGYFLNAPALKIDEKYWPAFAFDSSYESDQVKEFVLTHVKSALGAPKTQVFADPFSKPISQQEFNFNEAPF